MFGFDFVNDLLPGETLTSIVSFSIFVKSGTDPSPSSRLVGPPVLANNQAGVQTIVNQRVAGLLPDVKYILQAVAGTSLQNVKSLFSFVWGEEVS